MISVSTGSILEMRSPWKKNPIESGPGLSAILISMGFFFPKGTSFQELNRLKQK